MMVRDDLSSLSTTPRKFHVIKSAEVGRHLVIGSVVTNYHDVGAGAPVLLIHGSGPGVTAWANWRMPISELSKHFRCIAPDMAGFGYSTAPRGYRFTRQRWLEQLVGLLDELGIQKVSIIGNSFGGSLALALAICHPERVDRIVLMGTVGVPFELTPGLDKVWGYTPSVENMAAIMRIFAYDSNLISDDLVQMRYEASIRTGVQDSYAKMFQAPRQRWIEAMSHPESDIRAIPHKTLLIHGRDDRVIPVDTSVTLNRWIDDSQLHIFGRCGHWTQIEHGPDFNRLVVGFLTY
jgi:2-hydroxymuconate-semialdehyde hydrolase